MLGSLAGAGILSLPFALQNTMCKAVSSQHCRNRGMNCAERAVRSNAHAELWNLHSDVALRWHLKQIYSPRRPGNAESTWCLCWVNAQHGWVETLRPLGMIGSIQQPSLARSILKEGNELSYPLLTAPSRLASSPESWVFEDSLDLPSHSPRV